MIVRRAPLVDPVAHSSAPAQERGLTVRDGVWGAPPSRRYDDLAAPVRPIFRRIQEGATQRERKRVLLFSELQRLKDAGIGAVRAPCGRVAQ
jgi:hypothetical protein